MDRLRALTKVQNDFIDAATQGAIAVVQGHIAPMNPMEPRKSYVYVHNNIFFSVASDGRGVHAGRGGDNAARVVASREVRGVGDFNKVDLPGLHTLITVTVDYLGQRILAQSIIPGILQSNNASQLVYGSVDNGSTIATGTSISCL